MPLAFSFLLLGAVLASSAGPARSLFVAFAVEHLVLTLAAPLLLVVASTPRLTARLDRLTGVPALATSFRRPWRGFALMHVTVAVALLPPVLEAAHAHIVLWLLHRIVIFKVAFFLWWPFAAPAGDRDALSPPMRVLYAFLSTIPTSLVAVILARSPAAIYEVFDAGPALLGITPHQDQMLGALLMWIPALFFYLGAISWAFWKWQREESIA